MLNRETLLEAIANNEQVLLNSKKKQKGETKMSKVKQGQVTGHELNSCACTANTVASRIYNIIRAVGYGELSADNALHQLVEDYHTLGQLGKELLELSNRVPFEQEVDAE